MEQGEHPVGPPSPAVKLGALGIMFLLFVIALVFIAGVAKAHLANPGAFIIFDIACGVLAAGLTAWLAKNEA